MEASLLPAGIAHLPSSTNQHTSPHSLATFPSSSADDQHITTSLKRAVSPDLKSDPQARKRMKMDSQSTSASHYHSPVTDSSQFGSSGGNRDESSSKAIALSRRFVEELTCGCCTELCYNPVFLLPCQHFFCGSCTVQWIRHGGRDCPQCRASISAVTSAHSVQSFIDVFLECFPSKSRLESDRRQADEIYRPGTTIRIPPPREPSPEPNVSTVQDFVRPCRHCRPGNEYGWNCPIPVPDPRVDRDNAWLIDRGCPPGHAWCGNCDELHSIHAPHSSRCDLCLVSFCGIGIPRRCITLPLMSQVPEGLSQLVQLLSCEEIVEVFNGNLVERDYFIDHLQANDISPISIYRDVVASILSRPDGFQRLIEEEIFLDLYPSANTLPDANPEAPRQRICRICASEVFLWGLKDWWHQERLNGHIDPEVTARKDCPEGASCVEQISTAHSRQWNHFCISEFKPTAPQGGTNKSESPVYA